MMLRVAIHAIFMIFTCVCLCVCMSYNYIIVCPVSCFRLFMSQLVSCCAPLALRHHVNNTCPAAAPSIPVSLPSPVHRKNVCLFCFFP